MSPPCFNPLFSGLMISVTFALPQESRAFIAGLSAVRPGAISHSVRGRLGAQDVLVAHTGVGAACALTRITELLRLYQPRLLLSAGFAGGLDPRLGVGSLLVATNGPTPHRLARCQSWAAAREGATPPVFFGPLTTHPAVVETVEQKARLALESGALGVDMESAVLADVCRLAGLEFLVVRVISDSAEMPLPVPMAHWFDMERQCPKALALAAYLLRQPSRIAPFTRFVRGLGPARRALGTALLELIAAGGLAEEP